MLIFGFLAFLINKIHGLKILFYSIRPIVKSNVKLFEFNIVVAIITFFIQFIILSKAVIEQSSELYWSSSSRSSWESFISSSPRWSHFIHPSQTIIRIPTNNETSLFINGKLNNKSFRSHIRINLIPSIPFSIGDSISMRLKYILNNFLN